MNLKTVLITFITCIVLGGCSPAVRVTEKAQGKLTQSQLTRFAETLHVQYTVLNNRVKNVCGSSGRCFSLRIDLTNNEAIRSGNWQLYFSQYFPLHKVESLEFDVETINGDLKRIIPNENYHGFKAGERKSLVLYIAGTHGNEFEIMPNYYLAADDLEARTVKSTVPIIDPVTGLEIMPHLTSFTDAEKQFRITDREKIEWATSSVLYATNDNALYDPSSVRSAIIPTPYSVEIDKKNQKLDLSSGIKITLSGVEEKALAAAINRLEQFGIKRSNDGALLHIEISEKPSAVSGSYTLIINPGDILITASDSSGAFYALQSLASLVTLADTSVAVMKVIDRPRYLFRGLHLDVARNFHSKALVIKLLDQMAAYKLNKFHFHLGDDEGWRLQIPGLPELTDIGSKRCHDVTESRCVLPQLGSGPDGNSEVNGYFSTLDYEEILAEASARHIQVIPSFDMPGHSRAAVKSMEARYRTFMAVDNEDEARRYLLSDLEDASIYTSIQNYTDNTMNLCLDSAYVFVEKVIDELQAMHERAGQPLTRYHIGADETAGAWKNSPACEKFFADNDVGITTPKQLGPYFIERIAGALEEKGIEIAGWGDGMGHTNISNMPPVVQSNAWGRLIDPAHFGAHKHVNDGWEVVISTPDATYFDFPYEADPKERGFYWASRELNTRKVFEFMPDNLPAHAEVWGDSEGLDMTLQDQLQIGDNQEILHRPMGEGKGFAGMQGHIWSETMRTDKQVEYMAFPRLLALAERAWHVAPWEVPYRHEGASYNRQSGFFTAANRQQRGDDWNKFANVLAGKELAKLDVAGIAWRIPTVGAKIVAGTLHCNIIFPGLAIEFRRNGAKWQVYSGPVEVGAGKIEVRAISSDGNRKGRSLIVQ